MKTYLLSCLGAGLTLILAGCSQAPADTRDTVQDLRSMEVEWNRQYVAKDMEKLVAHYADDAVVIAPGMEPSRGLEGIRNMYKAMLSDPALSLKFQAARIEVAKSGDMAYTQGSYTMTMTDPKTKRVFNDHGSYVTTYRKQSDGAWKAVADIASSELPPAAPPAS